MCVIVCGRTGNTIADVGAQTIGDGLRSLASLTRLNLSCECDKCYLCLCLLNVLMGCVCLCVGRTGNKIADVGAQAIGDGLKLLTSLTKLIMSSE